MILVFSPTCIAVDTYELTPPPKDSVRLYLFYLSTRTALYREYLLFDGSAIVSAVGGSLGLFLGFSCWQAAAAAVGTVCWRRRGRRAEAKSSSTA